MIELLCIFVEGNTDKLFMDSVFGDSFKKISRDYKIVEYANSKKDKINNYIKVIKSCDAFDYVFVTDQDGRIDKKDKVLKKYSDLDEAKVFISVYEIESWILAGVSKEVLDKYSIKFKICDTSNVTKEKFEKLIPSKFSKIDFETFLLEKYDFNNALLLNKSLSEFNDYLTNKKAS